MTDYRKFIVSITIAILFTFFVFASIQAIKSNPNYFDFCSQTQPFPDRLNLSEQEYEEQIRAFQEEQTRCSEEYNQANKEYALVVFLISGVISLIGIFTALKLPVKKDNVMQMISSGILLGGLLTLFTGTLMGWQGIGIYFRPLVLLLELVLVIFLAYKTMSKK